MGNIILNGRIGIIGLRCAALALALSIPAVAPAADFVFGLTSATIGSCTNSGSGKKCTLTVGSETLQMRVSAWSTTSTKIYDAALGVYDKGLGVTADGESTSSPHHTIDNKTNLDFLIFTFDKPVDLISATFTPYSFESQSGVAKYDADFTIGSGNRAGLWSTQPGLNNTTFASLQTTLSATFGNGIASYGTNGFTSSSAAIVNRPLDPGNKVGVGNIWFLGAAMNMNNQYTPDSKIDGFKISSLTVRRVTPAVPEPATWMMMITGFGFVGGSIRRRKRREAMLAS